MITIETFRTEETGCLNLADETKHISQTINVPHDVVLTIIKGIDAYYYLMGIQDEFTFEDSYEMFIDSNVQPKEYTPDCVIDDDDMLAFISSHTDIADETIERVMAEDLIYQNAI